MTPPSASPVLRVAAMPADANHHGAIFGGWLLSKLDVAGGLIAERHVGGRAVTVAVEAMRFLAPIRVGDEVSVYGSVQRVGRTSLTILMEAWRREPFSEEFIQVTHATYVFVAIDADGRPRPLIQE